MNASNCIGTIKMVLAVGLLILTLTFAHMSAGPGESAHGAAVAGQRCTCCRKVRADYAETASCAPAVSEDQESEDALSPFAGFLAREHEPALRRVSVAAMVQRALRDQRTMLLIKQAELRRWGPGDQAHFLKWFGTTHDAARRLMYQRVVRVLEVNKNYSVENFRKAKVSQRGVYAYVRPTNPSRVYLDREFLTQPSAGEDSRAGTITHEMSHFYIVAGTKDYVYGQLKCKALARTSRLQALNNADNFEFWAEGAR